MESKDIEEISDKIPVSTDYSTEEKQALMYQEKLKFYRDALWEELGHFPQDLIEHKETSINSSAMILTYKGKPDFKLLVGEPEDTDKIAEIIASENMWKADNDLLVKHMDLDVKETLFVEMMKQVLGKRANSIICDLVEYRPDLVADMIGRHGKAYFISPGETVPNDGYIHYMGAELTVFPWKK
jgi:hypothetical protein